MKAFQQRCYVVLAAALVALGAVGCVREPNRAASEHHAAPHPQSVAPSTPAPVSSAEEPREPVVPAVLSPKPPLDEVVSVLVGKASYYSDRLSGRPTASGEPYDPELLTAAHRTLPFGTRVRVVRPATGQYVTLVINDRGPFAGKDRIIDVSGRAARTLGMIRAGVVPVRVEVLRQRAVKR